MKTTKQTLSQRFAKPLAIAALASSTVFAALPQSAAAASITRIGGAICQPYYGSQAGDFDYYVSGIRNRSSSARWVTCPIANPDASGSSISVWINVYNAGGSVNATCSTFSYSGNGSYLAGNTDSSIATGNSTAYTTISGSAVDGFLSAMCLLTPNSRVRSIFVYQ